MSSFKEGKQKLEDLTKLQEFRNTLKKLKKPEPTLADSVDNVFKYLHTYVTQIASIMESFFKDEKAADLLKNAGISENNVNDLKYYEQFYGQSKNYLLTKMYWGFGSKGGRPLSEIEKVAKYSSSESARIASLEARLGIQAKTDKVADLIAGICDDLMKDSYKICKQTEKSLTEYLQKEEAPKTSLKDVFRGGGKSFE